MDPNRDNLIVRFTAFWWALGVMLVLVLGLAIIAWSRKDRSESLEDRVAHKRYQIKAEVGEAQTKELAPDLIAAQIPKVAKELAASKPVGTTPQAAAPAPIDPAVMALGKSQFLVCAACHGQNGEGTALAPPLAGADWVAGPVENLIRIQLRGLQGPITVSGKSYQFPIGMAPLSYQTDEQIAAVLTYVRNSFGNQASAVTADQVKALRGEVGKPQLTVEELVKP